MEMSERKVRAETPRRKIPVVYYLCKNMNLEQPHFLEVPCSLEGLYLKGENKTRVLLQRLMIPNHVLVFYEDVIKRLNLLRGKGMAAMYSWSCKR